MIESQFKIPNGLSLPKDTDVDHSSHTIYLVDNNGSDLSITEDISNNEKENELKNLIIINNTTEGINGVNVTILKTTDDNKYLANNKTYYLFTKNKIRYLVKSDTSLERSKVYELIGNIKLKH